MRATDFIKSYEHAAFILGKRQYKRKDVTKQMELNHGRMINFRLTAEMSEKANKLLKKIDITGSGMMKFAIFYLLNNLEEEGFFDEKEET